MSARLGLIDAFIFSSPSRTVRCFLRMMQDKSILIHTGVTLYETPISPQRMTSVKLISVS